MYLVGLRSSNSAQEAADARVALVMRSSATMANQIVTSCGLGDGAGDWDSAKFEQFASEYTKFDPVVSGMFLVKRLPSGEWVYLSKPSADLDRDGRGDYALEPSASPNDRMDIDLPGLDGAWRGNGTLVRIPLVNGRPGFFAYSQPLKKRDGTVIAILVVTTPLTSWQRDVDAAQWTAFAVTALACLMLMVGGVAVTQLSQSLSNLRVTKAEAALQQEQIRSHMEIIAQKNQDMSEQQSQLAEAYSRLRALATTDGLTGLLNHRALMDFLSAAIRSNSDFGSPCSVILMDVDNFKQLNDQYGHPAGDEALRVLAAVLAHSAPPGSAVGRYGGEEFMLVIPGASESAATAVAEELRRRIQMAKTSSRPITVSVGVSTVYSMSKSEQALLDEADRALYSSKRNGKNRVTHYGQGLLETAS
jgi:diguanylate cyclase (GGDEF)-like protein